MSEATTVCNSWEIEAIRLTMEVVEQSTRIAGRNPRIVHLFIYHHQEWNVRNPFTPPEKVDSNRCDPQNAIRREHIPSTSTAESDTRSVTDESAPQKEGSRDIRIWEWAASVKIQFLESLSPQRNDNRISSSSLDQRTVSRNCFGIRCERTGPLKIHVRQRGNESLKLGSQRLSKEPWRLSSRSQENDQLLGGDSIEKQTSNACGQAPYASLFPSPSIRLKGTRSDALDFDLYGDNLKMFNLAGRKTPPALGHDLEAHVLGNVYERQV